MSQDLRRCLEVLGVEPQASPQELKAAYRDLAKVWHPDRFAHDPRLQQKAQEKLKEINEAYELLLSGKASFDARTAQPTAPAAAATRTDVPAPRPSAPAARTRLVPLSALVCVAVFCVAVGALLLLRRAPAPPAPARADVPTQTQAGAAERPAVESVKSASEEQRQGRKRQGPAQAATPANEARQPTQMNAPVRALPTVTLLIDPTTNLRATPACPNKLRVTYPRGEEPQQVCAAHQSSASAAPPAAPRGADARLKSFARRLLSPVQRLRSPAQPASAPAPGGDRAQQ